MSKQQTYVTLPNLIAEFDGGEVLAVWDEEVSPNNAATVNVLDTCAAVISAETSELLGVVRVDRETLTVTELYASLTGWRDELLETLGL